MVTQLQHTQIYQLPMTQPTKLRLNHRSPYVPVTFTYASSTTKMSQLTHFT
jgi:hypothetical protein